MPFSVFDRLSAVGLESHVKLYSSTFARNMCLPSGIFHWANTYKELDRIGQEGMFGYSVIVAAFTLEPGGRLSGPTVQNINETDTTTSAQPWCSRATLTHSHILDQANDVDHVLKSFMPKSDIPESNFRMVVGSHADLLRFGDMIDDLARSWTPDDKFCLGVIFVFQDTKRPNTYEPLPRLAKDPSLNALPTDEIKLQTKPRKFFGYREKPSPQPPLPSLNYPLNSIERQLMSSVQEQGSLAPTRPVPYPTFVRESRPAMVRDLPGVIRGKIATDHAIGTRSSTEDGSITVQTPPFAAAIGYIPESTTPALTDVHDNNNSNTIHASTSVDPCQSCYKSYTFLFLSLIVVSLVLAGLIVLMYQTKAIP